MPSRDEPRDTTVETTDAGGADTTVDLRGGPRGAHDDRDQLGEGDRVGRYRLRRVLGQGGMGTVYLAHDPQLARDVALKVLRDDRVARDPGARDALEFRLQREAQALARLSHPNVVTVFDVGAADGRLFLAMELVDGTTVAEWAKQAPRGWKQIVDVFVAAGHGLAAAHAAGIVHRDFKPANVMLDARGHVRVTDFGLARARGALDLDEPSLSDARADDLLDQPFTHAGSLLGTPRYMAPEQLARQPATAQSDQFAFCVSLFELVCGDPPFGGDDTESMLAAIRAGRIARAAAERAPRWLRRLLERGLAAEPARRFPSMDALLAAIVHGRRRPAVIGVIAGALALAGAASAVGLVLGSRAPAVDCTRAGDRAVAAWTPAEHARMRRDLARLRPGFGDATAARVGAAFDDYAARLTIARVDACRATYERGEQSARLLDQRMACLDERIGALSTAARALADGATAELVDRADDLATSLPSIDACADPAIVGAIDPPPLADAAEVARLDGALADAQVLVERGDLARGRAALASIVAGARKVGYAPLTARALDAAGAAAATAEDAAGAEPLLREATEAAAGARDDRTAAEAWIALLAIAGERPERADRLDATRAAARAAVARAGDRTLARRLEIADGFALERGGKFPDAAAACQRALDGVTPSGDKDDLDALRCVGIAKKESADYPAGRALLEQALALTEKTRGPDHPLTASALAELCNLEARAGRFDIALPLCKRALAIRERVFGADSENAATTAQGIANVLMDTGRDDEALPYAERAVDVALRVLGPNNATTGAALESLASTYLDLGRRADARRTFERAIAAYDGSGGVHPGLAITLYQYAEMLLTDGDVAAARTAAERSIDVVTKALGPDNPLAAFPLLVVGKAATRAGHPADAIAPIERAIALTDPTSTDPHNLAEMRFFLADALYAAPRGDRARARALATQALAAFDAEGPAARQEQDGIRTWLKTHP